MSNNAVRRHGLADFLSQKPSSEAGGHGIEFWVLSDQDYLNVRGSADNDTFLQVTKRHLGQDLPLRPNTFTTGPHVIYWLGPDEWLVVSRNQLRGVHGRLTVDLAKVSGGVSLMGGGFVGLQVRGPSAEALLRKGCTLDLHPSRFPVGSCAQTGLAKASVLISRHTEDEVFDVIVRRSFADYLAHWLSHAAEEFGGVFSIK